VVGVPAISGQKLLPRVNNFQNVDDMRAELATVPPERCRGMVSCWWEPQRILRDTIPMAIHHASLEVSPTDSAAATTEFAREYFGLRRAAVGPALWRLHELAPADDPLRFLYPDTPLDLHQVLTFDAAAVLRHANETATIHTTLADAIPVVKKHAESYQAYCLAADILAAGWANAQDFHGAMSCYGQAAAYTDAKRPREHVAACLDEALSQLQDAAARSKRIARAASAEWDRTRHKRDPKKDNSSPLLRQRACRAVLPILTQSAAYLAALSKTARTQIAAYKKDGPFPTLMG